MVHTPYTYTYQPVRYYCNRVPWHHRSLRAARSGGPRRRPAAAARAECEQSRRRRPVRALPTAIALRTRTHGRGTGRRGPGQPQLRTRLPMLTRTPRGLRTAPASCVPHGGTGQLAPKAPRTVRTPYAHKPRPCRMYRVPCGAPQVVSAMYHSMVFTGYMGNLLCWPVRRASVTPSAPSLPARPVCHTERTLNALTCG